MVFYAYMFNLCSHKLQYQLPVHFPDASVLKLEWEYFCQFV